MTRRPHRHAAAAAKQHKEEPPAAAAAVGADQTPLPPTTTTSSSTIAGGAGVSSAAAAKAPPAAASAAATHPPDSDTLMSLARGTDSDQLFAGPPPAAAADALSSDADAPTSFNAAATNKLPVGGAAAAACPEELHAAPPVRDEPAPATSTSSATTTTTSQQQRVVDAIRAEQRCQMLQARTKGATTQAQQRPAAAGAPTKEADSRPQHGSAEAARLYSREDGLFLDEAELLAASTFPIPPARLIELAKDALRKGVHKCDNLAPDFQFSAPFVGPLDREGFAGTMATLDLDSVFPDMRPRVYDLRVDPLQPNRVWFTTRPIGVNSGFLTAKLPVPQPPSYATVELPPQTSSLSFNEAGEVIDFTMGYVMDRRIGNSGGLGGAFGFLWALGVPFPMPEGKPWSASWQQRLFNSGSPLLQGAMFVLDRVSTALLPAWLTSRHNRASP